MIISKDEQTTIKVMTTDGHSQTFWECSLGFQPIVTDWDK